LVFNQIFGQSSSCLVAYLVVGKVELHKGRVEVEPRADELEQFIVYKVTREV
jgi:hypothetical protein